ncbi:SGNH/GDSL hydrolase family protein [Carboxylicivirga sp. N1Y90]|uniref:SGNH/GDSL hydrolase family protein n=1 Tax=Carboxylicivirga fragile TaxID=3417571 RepID=UPI003D34042B|nr:hypothetical protein [Marinilabiliaceae bacterium N1Y90]
MIKIVFNIILLSSLFVSCSNSLAQETFVAQDLRMEKIQVLGANYVMREEAKLSYNRFSEATLNAPLSEAMFNADKARTNSGIRLRFKSASPKIRLTFAPDQGQNRGAEFAVLQNGIQTHTFDFKGEKSKNEMLLEFENVAGEKESLFEVVLPSFANVSLLKMELLDRASLLSIPEDVRPIYFAIGNSITHGVGQGSAAYLTYPYLLAQKLDYNYYNLAVGGAKISPAIASMTGEMPQADVITILIGYNDLMFNDKSVKQYSNDYRAYLKTIRQNQPKAAIYCITLTHTRAEANERTGIVPDDFREALKILVNDFQKNGDSKLYLIEGDEISSEKNLRADRLTDKAHFGIEGAALFAEELCQIIKH